MHFHHGLGEIRGLSFCPIAMKTKVKKNYRRLEDASIFQETVEDIQRLHVKAKKICDKIFILSTQQRLDAQKGSYEEKLLLTLSQELCSISHDLITKSLVLDRTAYAMGPEEMPHGKA